MVRGLVSLYTRHKNSKAVTSLNSIDLLVVGAYFVTILAFGLYRSSRRAGAEEYFLAQRNLRWPTIGLSLVATSVSSTTFVGLAGSAYATGLSITNYEWMSSLVLVLFALYIAPRYVQSRVYTLPEFLERRFDRRCRYYVSALTLVGNVFVDMAGTLYAGALLLQPLLVDTPMASWPLWSTGVLVAALAGLYTMFGGLRAVVRTDAVQAAVLFFGASIMAMLAMSNAGSWSEIVAQTPPEHLSVMRPIDDPTMPWLGTLVGVPLLCFYFWCTNQFVVQRVLAARDARHAQLGSLLAAALKFLSMIVLVLPGLSARIVFPDLERPDDVFSRVLFDLVPSGVRGLVLAAFLAGVMSSVDSTLNSASTLITMDFVRTLRAPRSGELSDQHLGRIGRLTTLALLVVSAAWVPVVAQAGNLYTYLQQTLAYLVPPVAAIFVLGLFWKQATAKGAFFGLLIGHLVSLGTFAMQMATGVRKAHFLIVCGALFACSVVAAGAMSWKTVHESAARVARSAQPRSPEAQPHPPKYDIAMTTPAIQLLAAGIAALCGSYVAMLW